MSRSHDGFGVGVGEGPAAVCGHQSGAQGMRAVMPAFSPGDRNNRIIRFRFPAPTLLYFRPRQARPLPQRAGRPLSQCGARQARALPRRLSRRDGPTIAAREDARPPVAAVAGRLSNSARRGRRALPVGGLKNEV